jgi:hypothetical protein
MKSRISNREIAFSSLAFELTQAPRNIKFIHIKQNSPSTRNFFQQLEN